MTSEEQVNASLLPCPHCGAAACVQIEYGMPEYVFVGCSEKCTRTRRFETAAVVRQLDGSFGNAVRRQKIRLAIRASLIWNRRT